jgi:hypothetical protein
MWYMIIIPATLEMEVRGSQSEAGQDKSRRLCLKYKVKRAGIMNIPSKCESLISNPSTTKKYILLHPINI